MARGTIWPASGGAVLRARTVVTRKQMRATAPVTATTWRVSTATVTQRNASPAMATRSRGTRAMSERGGAASTTSPVALLCTDVVSALEPGDQRFRLGCLPPALGD